MGLRAQAAVDLVAIVEDADGFGWPITVTDPNGVSGSLVGLSTDIAQAIDPETGLAVAGRSASVALCIASLTTAGLGLPKGIAESTSKPWVVEFDDVNGTAHKFKVSEARPDRAAGLVVCHLESYAS